MLPMYIYNINICVKISIGSSLEGYHHFMIHGIIPTSGSNLIDPTIDEWNPKYNPKSVVPLTPVLRLKYHQVGFSIFFYNMLQGLIHGAT